MLPICYHLSQPLRQVIAFLQSKGKSQADAVELPREMKVKVNQGGITFQRTARSGVMRGSVRKATASSSAAELCFRASLRQTGEAGSVSPSSPLPTHRSEAAGEATRSSATSVHRVRGSADRQADTRQTSRSLGATARQQGQERPDTHSDKSLRKAPPKKPFRLHRFLTMVPSARDPAFYASSSHSSSSPPALNGRPAFSSSSSSLNSRRAYLPAASLEAGPSKSAKKERTLCLDLASQSKSQTSQGKAEHSRSHTAGPRRGGAGHGGSEGRLQYRISASRPRPSSLRVEQDATETQWKLTADFGERDNVVAAGAAVDRMDEALRQEKNVIRLPFVMVDSEDEDLGVAELKRVTKPQTPKSIKSAKSSRVKFENMKSTAESWVTNAEAGGGGGGEDGGEERTPCVTKETPAEDPTSQTSGLSSLPPAHTQSASSIVTAAHSDNLSDRVQVSDSSVDGTSEDAATMANLLDGAADCRLNDVAADKPHAAKRVNVNVPASRDQHRGGEDVTRYKPTPEYVTLSLRKEPHRTRERTYMSEIGGSDVFSDDTCAVHVNSESVRMSIKSDDMTSLAS